MTQAAGRALRLAAAAGAKAGFVVLCALAVPAGTAAPGLPPVPVPAENPISEPKRLLGKILFWDEQLSSDNMVACGTCHRPAAGGSDPRAARHPGAQPGSYDDVIGSPGIVRLDSDVQPTSHPLFGDGPQVTSRLSPSNFGGLWASALFWDGRAAGELRDPLTGALVIARGGALESQALAPLLNDVEMAKSGREWAELTGKLERVVPLGLASGLPPDIESALEAHAGYPELFTAAFGDPRITPVRIAFAIATYQRTLVADQTPWDRYVAGDADALGRRARYGWEAMQRLRCTACHEPPLFTNDQFFNIGLRRSEHDRGRQEVTADAEDAGDMRVPSLRNVALRPRFMHTGQFDSLAAAVGFYGIGPDATAVLPDRDRVPGGGSYAFSIDAWTEGDIVAFLREGLTDPRARDESFPFDRPVLRSERAGGSLRPPEPPVAFGASRTEEGVALSWKPPSDASAIVDYRLERDGRVIAFTTRTHHLDTAADRNAHLYRLRARDAAGVSTRAAELHISPAH